MQLINILLISSIITFSLKAQKEGAFILFAPSSTAHSSTRDIDFQRSSAPSPSNHTWCSAPEKPLRRMMGSDPHGICNGLGVASPYPHPSPQAAAASVVIHKNYPNSATALKSIENFRSFVIDASTAKMISECGKKSDNFVSLKGTPEQIALHEEFIEIVRQVEPLYEKTVTQPELKPLNTNCTMIVKCADSGVTANKEGNILLSAKIAEWCQEALSCTQALVEGVIEGSIAVAAYAYKHPIQTVGMVVIPELVMAYHLIPLSWDILKLCNQGAQITLHHVQGTPNAHDEFEEFIEPLKVLNQLALEYYTGNCWCKLIRDAASIVTRLSVEQRLYSRFHRFYRKAEKLAHQALKQGIGVKELKLATVPGGPNNKLVATRDKIEFKERYNRSHPGQEVVDSSGRETLKLKGPQATEMAKKLGFRKTNYYTTNKQPLYQKGNLYISPDGSTHSHGTWKMAKSVKDLESRNTRMGTYDADLNRIGD